MSNCSTVDFLLKASAFFLFLFFLHCHSNQSQLVFIFFLIHQPDLTPFSRLPPLPLPYPTSPSEPLSNDIRTTTILQLSALLHCRSTQGEAPPDSVRRPWQMVGTSKSHGQRRWSQSHTAVKYMGASHCRWKNDELLLNKICRSMSRSRQDAPVQFWHMLILKSLCCFLCVRTPAHVLKMTHAFISQGIYFC